MNKKTDTKVIIVDDSDFSRSIIRKILIEEGYQVVAEANSAENAMLLLKDYTPDIIITDIVMPEISGIELTLTLSKKSAPPCTTLCATARNAGKSGKLINKSRKLCNAN
jgi:two-component system chemotaxis response regulator CheY